MNSFTSFGQFTYQFFQAVMSHPEAEIFIGSLQLCVGVDNPSQIDVLLLKSNANVNNENILLVVDITAFKKSVEKLIQFGLVICCSFYLLAYLDVC